MTDLAPSKPAPTRRPRALPTFLAAIASFAVLFELLAFQLASGHDPSVGVATATKAVATKPQRPKRRVIVTRVITDVVPSQPKGSAPVATSTPTASSAPPASSGSSTASSSPAPSSPAPAAAPAPAPAPAPAAAVTSTS